MNLAVMGCTLIGAICGFLGTFLVARRLSLFGDMIGHAVLPGICAGFVIAHFERNFFFIFSGALASAYLASFVFEKLHVHARIGNDGALSAILTGFYGIGTLLLLAISQVKEGSQAGLESYLLGRAAFLSQSDFFWILGCGVVAMLAVGLMYRPFVLCCVDPESADLMGWNSKRILSALTLLIASTVIVAIPAVGVILACALLIIPAVAASLCSAHLKGRLLLGATFGAGMGSAGSGISLYVDSAPTGPMIVLVGIAILALCAIAHKVVSRGRVA